MATASKRIYGDARAAAEWRLGVRPGRAGDYIRPFSDVKPGVPVVLACRVSHCTQDHNGNLDEMETILRAEAEAAGGVVVGELKRVASGYNPFWIYPAVQLAKKHGAVILAECADRYVCHWEYHSELAPDFQAGDSELEDLRWVADGVSLVTFLDPNATPVEVRSYRARRGQLAKQNFGGPPVRKKNLRARLQPRANEMFLNGVSVRDISAALKIPRSTIGRWLQNGTSK